ncbi:hypothetical protein PUNSTDRAFT_106562 [Punctularia strigosozonata HHB-11173 SS5]|uniref:uncharacterized protein n=1 Tax=Punctularia strigosozonata (strain HHB-11173) TaxID=741275 RepID=UPI0004417291|nr:uncharacterized protein PUNSTDRAFT_106562 [Punctularia strigosozonata HHB-11173 SS5]EIN06322.1 hypothetical protein PUNSTDRAFT_106562 [Punctularia strigosozonata HHB-11173 SS5]
MLLSSTRRGPLSSLLLLSPLLLLPAYVYQHQYALPEPVIQPFSEDGTPQISEAIILEHARYLSEDIGYRTVGTKEHMLADRWMVEKVEEVKHLCEEAVKHARIDGESLECEVWRQEGSGSHRFDMMSRRLYKTYVGLSNVILRISAGTPQSKEHAVLVNAHLDSTLPSPGAADDALSVGVMLECARVLVERWRRGEWEVKHSVVFLFNHAEESLQDGSQLYSTQHPTASTVRAVINLEAAGTTGRPLLFQATSSDMIAAYSKVPRPFGTILANEIFSSGVLLSDTDFRQFEEYIGVPGLDIAVVGNSYLYHMRKDLVENIQPGVAQDMAENTLALLTHLSGPDSPLPSIQRYAPTKKDTVFYSYLGHFFLYTFSTARILHGALFAASALLVYRTSASFNLWKEQARGILASSSAFVGALVGANVVAFVMSFVLGHGMSWFSREFSCLVLYGPAAITGALVSQLFVRPSSERTIWTSTLLFNACGALALQLVGIGSAAMLFLNALPIFLALLLESVTSQTSGARIPLWVYGVAQSVPLVTGAQIITTTLDVFVPLTGRTGRDAPADHVVASIVAVVGSYTFPLFPAFVQRFATVQHERIGARASSLKNALIVTLSLTVVAMALFVTRQPFDEMHQKRLFVIHMQNTTTLEEHLHIAAADPAPGLETLVADIGAQWGPPGAPAPHSIVMHDWNADWDVLYPFSAFLSPFKIAVPTQAPGSKHTSPYDIRIRVENEIVDETAGTRSLTLVVDHPGIIWTAIAFDAHVLKWSLDDNPPQEYTRHHIKEASFYGVDSWSVDLVIKNDSPNSSGQIPPLTVDHVGILESGMWPAKKEVLATEGSAILSFFKNFDAWLEEHSGGTVDVLLLACVGGVSRV